MGTHAIFREQNGKKAPAAVVGVHIDYDKFETNFMKVTTGADGFGYKTNTGDFLSCKNESIECYVLDNNGFVMISEDPLNTGKFFGEIDGTILKSLEQNKVFKKIKIYDYQAICLENADDGSPAGVILTPFKMMAWLFNWLIGNIAMTIIRMEIHHLWNPDWTWALPAPQDRDYVQDDYGTYPYDYNDDYGDDDYDNSIDASSVEQTGPVVSDDDDDEARVEEPYDEFAEEELKDFKMKDGGPIPLLEMTYINKTQPKPCDKEAYLYELNETALRLQRPLQGILRNCHESSCERPFSVTLVPNTNLVLVVADKMRPCYSARISVAPTKVAYGPKNESAGNFCDCQSRQSLHMCINMASCVQMRATKSGKQMCVHAKTATNLCTCERSSCFAKGLCEPWLVVPHLCIVSARSWPPEPVFSDPLLVPVSHAHHLSYTFPS